MHLDILLNTVSDVFSGKGIKRFDKRLIAGLLVVIFSLSCGAGRKHLDEGSGVHFRQPVDYDVVLDEGARAKQPIVVYFTASWCGPCKVMDKYVFTDESLSNRMNEEFVCAKLDVDNPAYKDLVYIYDASVLPTFVIVNPKGRVLVRRVGSQSISGMHRFLDEALRAYVPD